MRITITTWRSVIDRVEGESSFYLAGLAWFCGHGDYAKERRPVSMPSPTKNGGLGGLEFGWCVF